MKRRRAGCCFPAITGACMGTGMCKNFRLLFSSRGMLLLILLSAGFGILFSYELYKRADAQSKIVIGLIDEDQSELSRQLIRRVRENESVAAVMGEEEKLYRLFQNREINSVFVIKKGFEQKIRSGAYQGVIRVEYPQEDGKYRIVSDMLGADLIGDICRSLTGNYYESVTEDTKEGYEAFFEQVKQQERFHYQFAIETAGTEGAAQPLTAGVSVVYQQIVVAFLEILSSFLLMEAYFLVTVPKNSMLYLRERSLPGGSLRYQAGVFLYYGVLLVLLSALMLLLIGAASAASGVHYPMQTYFSMFFWELLAGIWNYMIFYLCRSFFKKELPCQAMGMLWIFLTGAVSVLSLVVPQLKEAGEWIVLTHMMQQMLH